MILPAVRAFPLPLLLLSASALAASNGARTYDIAVEPVHEVCLEGLGDGAWATALLAPEGLAPALEDGRAKMTLCGTSARFGRRDFQEAILSVAVLAPEGEAGAYLVAALNSLRSYAWVERHRNRSPYAHGAVHEGFGADGARLSLGPDEAPWVLAATDLSGVPVMASPDLFEGALHQPGHTLFYARLEGEVARAPWRPQDSFVVSETANAAISTALLASQFTPTGWRLRAAGRHAKTNTLDR